MLAPRWWWPPRVRPLLKEFPPLGELPGHLYVRGMRALPEYVGSARRRLIEATAREQLEVFRGEAGRFRDIAGKQSVLFDALRGISTTNISAQDGYIGLHVRRGDFAVATTQQLSTGGALRTPTSWFRDTLRMIRRRIGTDVPARVLTDGRASDVAELLAEPNVTLVRTGAPLGDLLALAHARVLLASGSSFSAWACYLGGMPTATHPGQSVAWFGVPGEDFLGAFDPAAPSEGFLHAAAGALHSRK